MSPSLEMGSPPPPGRARAASATKIPSLEPEATTPGPSDGKGDPQKQQKACIHCRKSKVKCVHEGGPPCRRCRDANLECKFRLRADDENWRERTDETLSKLSNAVDVLLHRGSVAPGMAPPTGPLGPYPYPSQPPPMNHTMPPPSLPSPGGRPRGPGPSMLLPHGTAPPLAPSHHPGYPLMSRGSPHSDHSGSVDGASPAASNHMGRSNSFLGGRPPLHHTHSNGGDSPSTPSASHPSNHHRRTSSLRSVDVHSADAAHHHPPSLPPFSPGRATSAVAGRYGGSPPSALPTLPAAPLEETQTSPASSLHAVVTHSTPFYLTNPLPMRWTSGVSSKESYGAPVSYIGRDDPRLTCVSRGMLPLEKVRQLFMFFAERMQPHSFGFPTFPATENMTPLIISAIAMVSSLHEPSCRQYHGLLKADVLASIPDHELVEGRPLDPELGIGVEEITAACIASAWLGGSEAYVLARLARWWTLEYLRHYDLNTPGPYGNRTLTLGEALTILPPYRSIEHSVKVRIWLEAYVVDAQQAYILDREPMAAGQPASQYCEALRTAHQTRNGGPTGAGMPTSPSARLSQPDRQLIGHAAMLDILLAAKRAERRYSAGDTQMTGQYEGNHHEETVRGRLLEISGAMEATDRWLERCREDEDMSAATPSSMDLTLIFALARAFLGSQALDLPISDLAPPGGREHGTQSYCASLQASIVSMAKEASSLALDLACEKKGRGFGDRIVAMPTWYHFMLGQAVGFLTQLVQRKYRFLLAREARAILSKVESFVQLYIFEINSHAYQSPLHLYTGPTSAETGEPTCRPPPPGSGRHPASSTAEFMARALAHVKAQSKG
ncbi:unnamed protein product [Parajaminaea phylloscopi]